MEDASRDDSYNNSRAYSIESNSDWTQGHLFAETVRDTSDRGLPIVCAPFAGDSLRDRSSGKCLRLFRERGAAEGYCRESRAECVAIEFKPDPIPVDR